MKGRLLFFFCVLSSPCMAATLTIQNANMTINNGLFIVGDAVQNAPCIVFSSDTFTESNGELQGKTATFGSTWTARDATGGIFVINSNNVQSQSSAQDFGYYQNTSPNAADYTVQADISVTSSGKTSMGPAVRMNKSADQEYWVEWAGGSTAWQLMKRTGGTTTQLGSNFTGNSPAVSTVTVKVQALGTTIIANIAGVVQISANDASISAPGRPGIENAFADVAGGLLDNWIACQ
jgi:hypothetical protein